MFLEYWILRMTCFISLSTCFLLADINMEMSLLIWSSYANTMVYLETLYKYTLHGGSLQFVHMEEFQKKRRHFKSLSWFCLTRISPSGQFWPAKRCWPRKKYVLRWNKSRQNSANRNGCLCTAWFSSNRSVWYSSVWQAQATLIGPYFCIFLILFTLGTFSYHKNTT